MSQPRVLGYGLLVICVLCLVAGMAVAQEPNDTFQLTYYSNGQVKTISDATVHIVNPGTDITTINKNGEPTSGNLCADIFVYNNDEQAVECCACELTPDSERTLGIRTNLLANPVNSGNVTNDGVIKVISTALVNGTCPTPTGDTTITPTAGLRAWGTHWQSQGTETVNYYETEEEFAAAPLSSFEFEYDELQCSAIVTSGSKKGICSCGYGD